MWKHTLPTWYILKDSTFGSDLHAYLAPLCVEDDGEPNSVTPSRHQEEENTRGKKRRSNPSDPRGRRTYLYIWISSQEGSVWNLIHKHYSPGSPVFPSPAEKDGLFFWATLGNFSTTQSSFSRFNKRADWDLAPAMFHQTHLSSAIAGLSVSQTAPHTSSGFHRRLLKCGY